MANIRNIKVEQGNVLVLSGSSIVLSGSSATTTNKLIVNGELTASHISVDTITAREYYTELVTASVIYESGSTKFGDDVGDTHQITGSLLVTGSSVTLTGGSFNGSGAGLTNIPNNALDNNAITVNGQSTALGGTITTVGAGNGLTEAAPVSGKIVLSVSASGTDSGIDIAASGISLSSSVARKDRDADFGSNSVTASAFVGVLVGNADTATTADAVANAATFNDGGAGAASGTTFDGSAAVTISHNTIGAAGLTSNNTLTGINTLSNALNVFTGSFSGTGSNLVQLNAGNISTGTLTLNRGGTGADLSAANTGADGYVMVREGTSLVSYQLTSSDGTVIIAGNATTDKIDLTVSPSVGTGTVTSVGRGAGLENSGSAITVSGDIIVLAAPAGGINVASAGISVDATVVRTSAAQTIAGVKTFTDELSASAGLRANDVVSLGHFAVQVDSVSGNTIIGTDAAYHVILADASGGSLTVTLPDATAVEVGREYIIKKTDTSVNGVVVDGNGSQTIDGDETFTLFGPYQAAKVVTNGTAWFLV